MRFPSFKVLCEELHTKWDTYWVREEPRKVVVNRSLFAALCACLVHLPSLAVATILLWLNLSHFYIGAHLSQSNTVNGDSVVLALIQVAAKEILIILGAVAVISHVVKLRLLGDGVPYGWTAAAFSFVNPKYLWSRALWGGLAGNGSPQLKGLGLLPLIILGSFLALAAGPASAVLMLPRITTLPSFDLDFYLNGTYADYWPTMLTAEHVGDRACTRIIGKACVARGFRFFSSYYTYARDQVDYQIGLQEPDDPRIIQAYMRSPASAETWSFAPHAATSFVANKLWYDPQWYPRNTHPTGQRSMDIESQLAAVRTVCSRRIQDFSNETVQVSLPVLTEYATWGSKGQQTGPHMDIPLSKPLWNTRADAMTNSTAPTTIWVPAGANMSSVTTGLIYLSALNTTRPDSRAGVVCSIDARWNRATHSVTEASTFLGQSPKQGNPINATLGGARPQRDMRDIALPMDNGYWRRIAVDPSWLKALDVVDRNLEASKSDTTGIGNILLAANMDPAKAIESGVNIKTIISRYESIIATVFADAVSRVGSAKAFHPNHPTILTSPGGPHRCSNVDPVHRFCPVPAEGDHTRLTMQAHLKGYAFHASRVTDYLSIGVMILYMILALTHIMYLLISRRSCPRWDTVEEMLALSLASELPDGLKNTSAGIKRARTMGLRARVRKVETGKGEEVQLLVGGEDGREALRVEESVAYGENGKGVSELVENGGSLHSLGSVDVV